MDASSGQSETVQSEPESPDAHAGSDTVAVSDPRAWAKLTRAGSRTELLQAWLALAAPGLPDARLGVVLLAEPDSGTFVPEAIWPEGSADPAVLNDAAERAIAEREAIVQPAPQSARAAQHVAYPVVLDGAVQSVLAFALGPRAEADLAKAMRRLQWDSAWIETALRRERVQLPASPDRPDAVLELLSTALENRGLQPACTALATDLARRYGCDRVSIGFRRRKHTKIQALSHTAEVARRMNLMRAIGRAMDEAQDQNRRVLCRARKDDAGDPGAVTLAHARLMEQADTGAVLTVPLAADGAQFGALTLEHPGADGFDAGDVAHLEAVATVLGPVLAEKRANDRHVVVKLGESLWTQVCRLVGPRYPVRKVAVAGAGAAVAFFATFHTTYHVSAPATLQGTVERVVAAPFKGYVASAGAEAGDVVEKGDRLAQLETRKLELRESRFAAQRRQLQEKADAALARGDRAQVNVLRARLREATAQLALVRNKLEQATVRAPFDGVLVSGDLSQAIGSAVSVGEKLFEIAPLDSYRVRLMVDERDVEHLAVGQEGRLRVASMPGRTLPFSIRRITPVAEAQAGATRFRVEGELADAGPSGRAPELLPGMEGVGKVAAGERLLIWIWTRDALAWLRLQVWRWWP